NSLPRLATAAAGRRHLTLLNRHDSRHRTNAICGNGDLLGGLMLIGRTAHGEGRWNSRVVLFYLGAASFAAWAAISEHSIRMHWDPVPNEGVGAVLCVRSVA